MLSVESWEPRRLRLSEIKASRPADPGSEQVKRLHRLTTLINESFHPGGDHGVPLLLEVCPRSFRTHLGLLEDALDFASTQTYTALLPEDGLLIEVYDQSNPLGLDPGQFDEHRERQLSALGWDQAGGLSYSVSSRILRDRITSFSTLAPLPLLPLRLDRLSELMLGRFDVVTSFDPDSLEERLLVAGIEATVCRPPRSGECFIQIARGGSSFTAPGPFREQVLIELMTLETLTETLAWYLADAEKRGQGKTSVALTHADESLTWTAFP